MASRPQIHIKNQFQKGGNTYQNLLPEEVLADICERTTGTPDFDVDFDNASYNKGRLLEIDWQDEKIFISLSPEGKVQSRNSSFQSFSTALNRYLTSSSLKKKICYYYLPSISGNFQTNYFDFMYRLMSTIGVQFLNPEILDRTIVAFRTAGEIELFRASMQASSSGNRSSYLTRGPHGQVQIYGKTYGASKYETTLIAAAVATLESNSVELYEVPEGGLKVLPKASREALQALGNIRIITPDDESQVLISSSSADDENIRSSRFIYNLLKEIGQKECQFCECTIQQIVQGAHVWPIKDIRSDETLSLDTKIGHAVNHENGMWLCENHHKLFDRDLIVLDDDGQMKVSGKLSDEERSFVKNITSTKALSADRLTDGFLGYLTRRNEGLSVDVDDYELV